MYKYTFIFILNLTTTLPQMVAKLYLWKVKKNDGMNQNTFHRFYGDYVTTNQQA